MAKPSLETINERMAAAGLPPLTKLPNQEVEGGSTVIEEEKVIIPGAESAPVVNEAPALTEASVLEFLKSQGITAASLKDLQPKAPEVDAEAAKLQRENEKIAFALQRGLVNRADYDNFIKDSTDNTQLVFRQFHAEAIQEDSSLTDEEITAEFNEKYGLTAEPGTRKHKRGQTEIQVLANTLLKNKYGKVYEIDSAFDKFETEQKKTTEYNARVIAQAPIYKADVESVFAGLKSVKETIGSEEIDIEIPAEILNHVKTSFLSSTEAQKAIDSGWNKEDIREVALSVIYRTGFKSLAQAIANKLLLKHQAGTAGIPPLGGFQRKEDEKVLNDNQRMMVEEYKKQVSQNVPAPAAN